ncbi:MAG: alr0857 family protein [Cyanobacteria bacterium J06638_20]
MLKLTYTADGLFMEQIAAPLEVLVAQRVMLALRTGQTLHVEPGRASFLIAKEMRGLTHLQTELQAAGIPDVDLTIVDEDFIEVSLHGSWIAESPEAEEGMFIVALPNRLEFFVHKLWQMTQGQVVSAR